MSTCNFCDNPAKMWFKGTVILEAEGREDLAAPVAGFSCYDHSFEEIKSRFCFSPNHGYSFGSIHHD